MNARFAIVGALLFACISSGCSETGAPVPEQAIPESSESAASKQTQAQAEGKSPAEVPAPPTEEQMAKEVQSLYAAGKFEEAEERFAVAREAFPDSIDIQELHGLAAAYLRQSNKLEEAFAHMRTLTDIYMEGNYDRQGYSDLFGWRLGELAHLADSIEGPPDAEILFADYLARASNHPTTKPILTNIITTQKAIYLAGKGRLEEARELVDKNLVTARERLEASPEDVAAVLGVADQLDSRLQVESSAGDSGDVETARSELLDFVFSQAQGDPKSAPIRQRFFRDHYHVAKKLATNEPKRAAATIERIEEFEEQTLVPLGDDETRKKWRKEIEPGLDHIRERIEVSLQRFALIGTPAVFPEGADGWVGTDPPLTSDQLRGKVVLLDFFAVWCGPCIATFPHLRSWHDEFADDGLQVIGVSEYQSFGWDAEAGRPKRIADLEPEAERAAMEQFAAHHSLAHAITFTPDNELQKHYVVNGIPHVVLIDRAGKVRMHRIGSGERNAADLEQAIKECLAEPVPPLTERS